MSLAVIDTAAPAAAERANLPASVAVAGEVLEHMTAELPALGQRGERDRLLLATWLLGLRSPRTRKAYLGDVTGWLDWLAERGVDVLDARRVHVDLWVSVQLSAGAAETSVRRRLSALSRFYEHLAAHDLVDGQPVAGVARPKVADDQAETIGLDRDQARALLEAADRDRGRQRRRSKALVALLLHNGLRVDELLGADVADLSADRGHRVLGIVGKGNRKARVPLAPATWAALEDYLTERAEQAGLGDWRGLDGPLLVTATGRRVQRSQVWELVQRLARVAGVDVWSEIAIHSLRHTAITLALDAGASLRDVQDYARHKDARTTRRYDRSRGNLDRSPAYTVAAYLA